MAHFAKLDQNNIVITINVVHNNELLIDGAENEQKGINFLNNLFNTNDNWKQTSYNTLGGVHKLDGTPFRKNYAGIGYTYNENKDAFIPPKPYSSWTLNDDTCRWEAPVAYPDDGKDYRWNEETTNWVEKT
tara:strand:- start:65 stop:457 length:393 start_codon:yes stop_codon:yes gene_type:complete